MTKTVQELVHEQVAAKIAAGEALQAAVVGVSKAQSELDSAESEAAKARRAALKSGWTETELKSLGLASKTRPRRRAATTAPAPIESAAGTTE
jgi:hypothetical protein